MDEQRAAAAEAAARLVVAAVGDDHADAADALADLAVDPRLVAVAAAAIAAKALRLAYGSDQSAYDAAARQLAQARGAGLGRVRRGVPAGVMTAITWHRGHGGDMTPEIGTWHAKANGHIIALAWWRESVPVGHPDRWNGEIYGKHASTTTLREFKALVAKAYAEREQA
jgi:hypothetical protein